MERSNNTFFLTHRYPSTPLWGEGRCWQAAKSGSSGHKLHLERKVRSINIVSAWIFSWFRTYVHP